METPYNVLVFIVIFSAEILKPCEIKVNGSCLILKNISEMKIMKFELVELLNFITS